MLKKYKIPSHVHDEHCGHEHNHHEHGEHCSHEHHHGEHCGHEHNHHEHDEVQILFEDGKISEVQKRLAHHSHDHSYDLALCEWELTKSDGAFEALRKLTEVFAKQLPQSIIAHLNLGLIYKEKSHFSEAKAQFEKVIQLSKSLSAGVDERAFAEAELAKIQASSLKNKLLNFFK